MTVRVMAHTALYTQISSHGANITAAATAGQPAGSVRMNNDLMHVLPTTV